jgi:hypothetical protein
MDIAFAQRSRRIPLFNKFLRDRVQRFCVLEEGARKPDELRNSEFLDIEVSAIHLPPTTESLRKIERTFQMNDSLCRLDRPKISPCSDKEVIFYSIITRINPHRR